MNLYQTRDANSKPYIKIMSSLLIKSRSNPFCNLRLSSVKDSNALRHKWCLSSGNTARNECTRVFVWVQALHFEPWMYHAGLMAHVLATVLHLTPSYPELLRKVFCVGTCGLRCCIAGTECSKEMFPISGTLDLLLFPSLSPDFGKDESQHCEGKQTEHKKNAQHFAA